MSIIGVRHLFLRARSTRSLAVPGSNVVCGLSLAGGLRSKKTAISAKHFENRFHPTLSS